MTGESVQRLFEGARAKNFGSYAEYIVGIHDGRAGITPAIILYSEDRLHFALEGQFGHGTVLVPWGKKLVAIDGKTQLAARYEAANRNPETLSDYIAVHICHGLPRGWARQAFHDLNVLAIRPNSAITVGMDARDPLTAITREVEARVPFFTGRVNKTRRQFRSTEPSAPLSQTGQLTAAKVFVDLPHLTVHIVGVVYCEKVGCLDAELLRQSAREL